MNWSQRMARGGSTRLDDLSVQVNACLLRRCMGQPWTTAWPWEELYQRSEGQTLKFPNHVSADLYAKAALC